jgi:Type I phosphodiesterase / nucleotide pyrophosphatase
MVQHRTIARAGLMLTAGFALTACGDSKPTAPATALNASIADMRSAAGKGHGIKHVLLISVDGMHNRDLARYVETHPHSVLAKWEESGVTYTNVTGSKPSDSYPGLQQLIAGASPAATGIYYDVSYDRHLSPPGSNCSTVGTAVTFDESIDINSSALDGGGGINTAALPRDPSNGCKPVFPWQYVRVNNIFEVAREAGLVTAWSDKHIGAYTIVEGPSGKGVTDLANLEVAGTLPDGHSPNDDVNDNITYDSIKVGYVLNWCRGLDHTGKGHIGVPSIFGMDYQVVSTGEIVNGYARGDYEPTAPLEKAFDFVDSTLGRMEATLRETGVADETLIIVTAKHGQGPVNPAERKIVADTVLPTQVDSIAPNLVASSTLDDIGLLWLSDQSLTTAAVEKIRRNAATNFAQRILWGRSLTAAGFPSPLADSRTPDIIVLPRQGVIYDPLNTTVLEDHGGFNSYDVELPILLFLPGLPETRIDAPVDTREVATTTLFAIGLNPGQLAGAAAENTPVLPGWSEALRRRSHHEHGGNP